MRSLGLLAWIVALTSGCAAWVLEGDAAAGGGGLVRATGRRFLVLAPIGDSDKSAFPHTWLDNPASRTWDILALYYGTDPEFACAECLAVVRTQGAKWHLLWEFSKTELFREVFAPGRYDAVMLPDDDLLMSTHAINTCFALLRRHDLLLAQPSVCKHANSFTWIASSVQRAGLVLHYSAMVEIMARAGGAHHLNAQPPAAAGLLCLAAAPSALSPPGPTLALLTPPCLPPCLPQCPVIEINTFLKARTGEPAAAVEAAVAMGDMGCAAACVVVPTLEDAYTGWGVDIVWSHLLGVPRDRIAPGKKDIYSADDSNPFKGSGPVEMEHQFKKYGVTREAMAAHGLEIEPRALGGVKPFGEVPMPKGGLAALRLQEEARGGTGGAGLAAAAYPWLLELLGFPLLALAAYRGWLWSRRAGGGGLGELKRKASWPGPLTRLDLAAGDGGDGGGGEGAAAHYFAVHGEQQSIVAIPTMLEQQPPERMQLLSRQSSVNLSCLKLAKRPAWLTLPSVATAGVLGLLLLFVTSQPSSSSTPAAARALRTTAAEAAGAGVGPAEPPPQDKWDRLLEEVLAGDATAARECSAEHKAAVLANSTAGKANPPVLAWGCELEQCDGDFVARLVASHRARNSSLLGMTPCDLFRQLAGRTLWLLGDSQMQRSYTTLDCFMAPFLERTEEPRRRADFVTDPAELTQIKERVLDAPASRGLPGCGEWCGARGGVGDLWCTHLLGGTRICHIRANRAQHIIYDFLPNLRLFNVSRDDILITNFGLWHHKREGDYAALSYQLAGYHAAHRQELPRTFIYRDSSPQARGAASGSQPAAACGRLRQPPTRLLCTDSIAPQQAPYYAPPLQHFDIANGEFPHPDEASSKLKWPFKCVPIKTWNETVPLWDGHVAEPQVECSHWCHPGAYNIYAWQLWELLERIHADRAEAADATARQERR
eukprot:scaffold2.g7455.t1